MPDLGVDQDQGNAGSVQGCSQDEGGTIILPSPTLEVGL